MNAPDAIDIIRQTVVQVRVFGEDAYDPTENKVIPILTSIVGTGFIVNKDACVVTASHVISDGKGILDLMKARNPMIQVGLASENTDSIRGNFTFVDCDILGTDDVHDLALLKLKRNPFKDEVSSGITTDGRSSPLLHGIVVLSPNRPKEGIDVAISGYPLESTVLVTNRGSMATVWESNLKSQQLPKWISSMWPWPEFSDFYLADVEVNPGNSGGPVYSIEDARVIGMCSASKFAPVRDQDDELVTVNHRELRYSSGLTIVMPSRYIIELLSNHGLSWK